MSHACAGATAAGIIAAADVGCQTWLQPDEQHGIDWRRTIGLTVFAGWHYGGPGKFLYLGYDRVFQRAGSDFRRAALSVVADVGAHTPFLLLPSFYVITGAFKEQSLQQSLEQLQREWLVASFGSAAFWTPVCFLNFRVVTQHSRIFVLSCASFVDKTLLSYWSNRGRHRERLQRKDGDRS